MRVEKSNARAESKGAGVDPEESFDGMDGDDNLLLAAKIMDEVIGR